MSRPRSEPSLAKTVRLPISAWRALRSEADRRKIKLNALIREKLAPAQLSEPSRPPTSTTPVKPKPQQTEQAPEPTRIVLPIGPITRKPGDMLKRR